MAKIIRYKGERYVKVDASMEHFKQYEAVIKEAIKLYAQMEKNFDRLEVLAKEVKKIDSNLYDKHDMEELQACRKLYAKHQDQVHLRQRVNPYLGL